MITTKRDKGSFAQLSGESLTAKRALSLGLLGNTVGFHLRLAHDASFAHFTRQIGDSGMRPGRFAILELIGNNPNISQQELSEISGRDKSTTSIILRDLEKRKLVMRRRSEHDRRLALLNLTPQGEAELAKTRTAAAMHERRLDEILGDRRSDFIELLMRVQNGLNGRKN